MLDTSSAEAAREVDAVTLEVFHSALIATAHEMGEALRRSAYSPIIREMLDYSAALFDLRGRLIAQAENIPALLGAMTYSLGHLLERHPVESLRPDDAFITNDPYRGGSHTPDVLIFTPVFHDGVPIAFAGSMAHHVDVGGKNPGTEGFDNASIFEEGLRFPPVRLIDGGEPIASVYDLIAANVRDAHGTLGDLRAQLAACRFGERRMNALADRYGVAAFHQLVELVLDYSERRTRAELAALPDGEAMASGFLDDDGRGGDPVEICVRVTVSGSDVTVDFTGTSSQTRGGMNVPLASSRAAVLYAVKSIVDPTTPQNDGCFRPIRMVFPESSFVNPSFPAAVSLRHLGEQRAADTILRAFAALYPERAAAGAFVGFSSIAVENHHPRTGQLTVLQDDLGGGMGGFPGGDGIDAVDTHMGNVGMLPAEICEVEYPVRVLSTELRPGSGGDGKFRGGLGIRRMYEFLGEPQILVAYTEQRTPEFGAWGLAGGGTGAPARITYLPRDGEPREIGKEVMTAEPGDRLLIETGGGGGFGNPAAREHDALERDRREEKDPIADAAD